MTASYIHALFLKILFSKPLTFRKFSIQKLLHILYGRFITSLLILRNFQSQHISKH